MSGKLNVLSTDDIESENSDEETDDDEDAEDTRNETEDEFGEEEETEEDTENNEQNKSSETDIEEIKRTPQKGQLSVEQFLNVPSADNFLALGPDRVELILEETKVGKHE